MSRAILASIFLAACLGVFAGDTSSDSPAPQELAQHIITAFQSGHAGQLRSSLPADIPILEKAAKDLPRDSLIHFALGICYMSEDRRATITNFEIAFKNSNKNPNIGVLYALSLKMDKQPLKAYELYREMAALHPDVPRLQVSLAAFDITIQKYDEAIVILEKLQQKASTNLAPQDKSTLLLMQGTCYLHKGYHAKAIEVLENSQSITPKMAMGLTVLGEAYLKNGHLNKASETLDKALAINPRIPSALYYRAICSEKAGHLELAQKDFHDAYTYGKQRLQDNGEDYYLMFLISQKLARGEEGNGYKAEAEKLFFINEAPWKQE